MKNDKSSKSGLFRRGLVWFLSFQMLLLNVAPAFALPSGESVQHGDVGFTRSGDTLTVNQGSGSAIVNYDSFSIGQAETVQFCQPNSAASILNRVTGDLSSEIAGMLLANGNVYLVNLGPG